jgi:hypothetical protein
MLHVQCMWYEIHTLNQQQNSNICDVQDSEGAYVSH